LQKQYQLKKITPHTAKASTSRLSEFLHNPLQKTGFGCVRRNLFLAGLF
jgi:hypothetical protein